MYTLAKRMRIYAKDPVRVWWIRKTSKHSMHWREKNVSVHSVEVGHCVAEEEMKCAVPSPRQTMDYQEKESP